MAHLCGGGLRGCGIDCWKIGWHSSHRGSRSQDELTGARGEATCQRTENMEHRGIQRNTVLANKYLKKCMLDKIYNTNNLNYSGISVEAVQFGTVPSGSSGTSGLDYQ